MSNQWRAGPGGHLRGTVTLPGDKSISHRALMLSAIAEGPSRLHGVLDSEDCHATARAFQDMGVSLEQTSPTEWRSDGGGLNDLKEPKGALNLGNSGTSMRLLCGLLCNLPFPLTLIGDSSLSRRPMQRVATPLQAMGAQIETTDGHAPVRITPTTALHGCIHDTPIESAQVKSAILLAGMQVKGRTCLNEQVLGRDHTERMLPAFGGHCEITGSHLCIEGKQTLKGTDLAVPQDISAAAFFIVGACIAPDCELQLTDVGLNPRRDGVLRILREMGADLTVTEKGTMDTEPFGDIRVRSSTLKGITVDPTLVPNAIDEFPILCIAAACAHGTTEFYEVGELRLKESDRIAAMEEGLRRLGIKVETGTDFMRITGGTLQGGTVDSHEDHRIAMAFAIASLVAREPITIQDTQWVATSFPGFADLAREAGLQLHDD